MLAVENLYALRSLDSSKPMREIVEEFWSALRDAFLGSLRPKLYYCQQIAQECRQRLYALEKLSGSQKLRLEIDAELQAVAEYLYDAELTLLHRQVNITEQPFQTGTVEVSQIESGAFPAESYRGKHSPACLSFINY